jgi:ATP adenylyltransferase
MGGPFGFPHTPPSREARPAKPWRASINGTPTRRVKRLWAPWRMGYVAGPRPPGDCVFCEAPGAGDDRARLVLDRSDHGYLILNAYPYASGHLMAVVYRHIATLGEATRDELTELMTLATRATALLGAEYGAEGFNVGLNLGRAAGAGIAEHLHLHVVPRWNGDANFVAVVGEVRVLPEALTVTYDRLQRRLHG